MAVVIVDGGGGGNEGAMPPVGSVSLCVYSSIHLAVIPMYYILYRIIQYIIFHQWYTTHKIMGCLLTRLLVSLESKFVFLQNEYKTNHWSLCIFVRVTFVSVNGDDYALWVA